MYGESDLQKKTIVVRGTGVRGFCPPRDLLFGPSSVPSRHHRHRLARRPRPPGYPLPPASRNGSSTPAASLKLGPKFVRAKSFAPIQRTSGFLKTGFFVAGQREDVVHRLQDIPTGG